jgi:hypothetical protein
VQQEPPGEPFFVKPYIQLGNNPKLSNPEKLLLLWHAEDADSAWLVEVKNTGHNSWHAVAPPQVRQLLIPGLRPRREYRAELTGLAPGGTVTYRVSNNGSVVFEATAQVRKGKDQPCRMVVFGDIASGTAAQPKIAYQVYKSKPDMAMITGDIVYRYGTYSLYLARFFPVYNAEQASLTQGSPLIRSSLLMASPGNHDIDITAETLVRNLDNLPDGLAYFYMFQQPLNGPLLAGSTKNIPELIGTEQRQQAFRTVAGANYPRMTNFSFDYGNVHWTVIDANAYMDWTDPLFLNWLKDDLKNSKDATWHFVAFHQAPFSSGAAHFNEQRMRQLAPVFSANGVDIVFSGHMHNYQRSYPLSYTPKKLPDGKYITQGGFVDGSFTFDKSFNGRNDTTPEGVIYIVTGAGGADLSGGRLTMDRSAWEPFTANFSALTHSYTVCDINGKTMTMKQLSEDGIELDSLTISKVPALTAPQPSPVPAR